MSRATAVGRLSRLFVLLLPLLFASLLPAQIVIRVPLRITIADRHFDSTRAGMQGHFKFALVDAAGESLWSQDGSSMQGSAPEGHVKLHVTNGIVVVPLGEQSVGQPIDGGSLSTDMPPVKLRVWFGTDPGMFAKLSPDFPLSTVPAAAFAQALPNNSVDTAAIPDGSITRSKLANGSVGPIAFAQNAILPTAIADNAMTSDRIADQTFSPSVLGTNLLGTMRFEDSGIDTGTVADNAVTTTKIAAHAVTSINFELGSNKLIDGAVTSIKIGSHEVAGNHFDGAIISTDKFANNAVVADKIPFGAVTASKVAAGAVNGTHIDNNIIHGSKLARDVVADSLTNSPFGFVRPQAGLAVLGTNTPAGNWIRILGKPAYGNSTFLRDLSTNNMNLDNQARFGSSHVWNGQQWFVWGKGTTESRGSPTAGVRYNTHGGLFHTVPVGSSPLLDRIRNALVWTGKYYIVWGGDDGRTNGIYTDGAFFDSLTQKWTRIATNGAPSARNASDAFSWKRKMGLWGGDNGSDSDLYVFDPSVGSNGEWETTSFTDQDTPTGRFLPTVVWTGDRLIVWGGESGNIVLNSGSILNPGNSSDPWKPMSLIGAPAGRREAVGVFTGAEMIVWGGHDNQGNALNSGGRYNIVTDSWTALPTANAPSYESGAQAIWTGLEMVIFAPKPIGGNSAANNKLYRYNLAADKWTVDQTFATGGLYGAFQNSTRFAWLGDRLLIYNGINTAGGNFDFILSQSPRTTWFVTP